MRPAFLRARNELCAWAEEFGLGEFEEHRLITDDTHVFRWAFGSVTLRLAPSLHTERQRRSRALSGLDQELPPLPYTVDRDGKRHYEQDTPNTSPEEIAQ